jgi:hypothetical protein
VIAACATRTEARAAARVLGPDAVRRVGVGARRDPGVAAGTAVVSVGVCGALRRGIPPGTVVIPDRAGRPGGVPVALDAGLLGALRDAADRIGVHWCGGTLVTSGSVVSGAGPRARLAGDGWDAVDMETAALAGRGLRLAAVRAVLDTPDAELDPAWAVPWRAMADPRRWPQGLRLGRDTRRLTALAASVVAAAWLEGG